MVSSAQCKWAVFLVIVVLVSVGAIVNISTVSLHPDILSVLRVSSAQVTQVRPSECDVVLAEQLGKEWRTLEDAKRAREQLEEGCPHARPQLPPSIQRWVSPQHELLFMTFNAGHRPLASNWVAWVSERLKLKHWIAVALDEKAMAWAKQQPGALPEHVILATDLLEPDEGVNCPAGVDSSSKDKWDGPVFRCVVGWKMRVARMLVREGISVLTSDVDIVFRVNPWPVLREEAAETGADYVCQADGNNWKFSRQKAEICSGFCLAVASRRADGSGRKGNAFRLLDRAIEFSMQKGHTSRDQPSMNDAATELGAWKSEADRTPTDVRMHVLDRKRFPNGYFLFKKPHPEVDISKAVIVHANFLETSAKKIAKLKEMGLWLGKDEADTKADDKKGYGS